MSEDEEPDDDVARIARHAAKRGFWSERSARDMAAQARLHATSPRTFLRKMLEIKGGLTYDEISRLEKEALAPPAPPPPSKPLPRAFDGSGAPVAAPEIQAVTEARVLPKPFEAGPAPTSAPTVEPMATPSRSIPRMLGKSSGAAPALPSTTPPEGTVLKKKLPSLGAKRPSSPANEAVPPPSGEPPAGDVPAS